MADLSNEELRVIKSLNAKAKSLGGKVVVEWKDEKIAIYDLTSTNTGEAIYRTPTLGEPNKSVECKD